MVFFFHLGTMPFYGADEPRYARIGQEMLESGDYVTPTLDHRPWLEKPPLLYWMEAGSYALLGVSEGSARMPNALIAFLAALLLAWLGWRITGEAWVAVFAFLALVSSFLFALFGRAASTDMAMAAPYLLMMVGAFLALERDSKTWAALSALGGALAVLAKGPVGVVLGIGSVAVYLLLSRRKHSWSLEAVFFTSFLALALPWFLLAWLANGENFFLTFIVSHHIARFVTDIHHHSQPFWYYLPVLLAGFFPWVFFLFPAGRRFLRECRDFSFPECRLKLFLWIWALVPILFFSASSAKLPGYILPATPPLALLVGLEWNRYRERTRLLKKARFLPMLVGVSASIMAVGLVVGSRLEYGRADVGLAIAIPLLVGVGMSLFWARKGAVTNAFLAMAGGMIALLAVLYAVGSPVIGSYHSTASLVSRVSDQLSSENPLVQYRFFHHTAIYYTGGNITPDSINSPEEMRAYIARHPRETYFLLTTSHGWDEFHDIQGVRVAGREGKLYILRLPNDDGSLSARIREKFGDKGQQD